MVPGTAAADEAGTALLVVTTAVGVDDGAVVGTAEDADAEDTESDVVDVVGGLVEAGDEAGGVVEDEGATEDMIDDDEAVLDVTDDDGRAEEGTKEVLGLGVSELDDTGGGVVAATDADTEVELSDDEGTVELVEAAENGADADGEIVDEELIAELVAALAGVEVFETDADNVDTDVLAAGIVTNPSAKLLTPQNQRSSHRTCGSGLIDSLSSAIRAMSTKSWPNWLSFDGLCP